MRLDASLPDFASRAVLPAGAARERVGLSTLFAGMTEAAHCALTAALDETGGLILVAGPTGSGRATTLRALLRARPDALAIGSVDSDERVKAALQVARGRLVLVTGEAGDAITATRGLMASLTDPFPLACVLRLVLAQRLARRLCPSCRVPTQQPNSVTAPLGLDPGAVVYRAQGCDTCDGTGYAGPIGAFETLPVDTVVGRLILQGAEEAAIANHVFRTWPNMAAAVRALVIHGHTTAEEGIELLRPQRQ